MTTKHKCSKEIWTGYSSYPCLRPATVERDGQWWCWQHNPERVKADKEKRQGRLEMIDCQAESFRSALLSDARNAKLAALVTVEMAELLERLARWADNAQGYAVGHWTTEDDQIGTDSEEASALAARIREALEEKDNVKDA